MLIQESLAKKINDTAAEAVILEIRADGVKININDLNGKIEDVLSDKEQIKQTKKKLARE